jgi:amidase
MAALDPSLGTWSATRLCADLRSGALSSRALLELYLDRIERLGPALNAIATLDVDRARAAADRADGVRAAGQPLGALHGLPITVKDAIETEGLRSTGGAVELADHVPDADAPAVARLKAAGAIVFGKTNLPRWSGDIQTFNEMFGTTNNPWNAERVPGGSSGGSAAAVAAGLTGFDVGTDIGGSVRIPAHCCGVYGLKPSFGVVSGLGYLDHGGGGTTAADINVFGPLARAADDLALAIEVMAGPDPRDEPAWRLELPAADVDSLRGLQVATWFDDQACPLDHEYAAALGIAAETLGSAGAQVVSSHPDVSFTEQFNLFMQLVGGATSPSRVDTDPEGLFGSHRDWLRANEQRAALQSTWSRWFENFDVLLCPVLSIPACRHDHDGDVFDRTVTLNGVDTPLLATSQWLGLVGVIGLPSVVIPIGRTSEGLPVGMQIVAPYLRDHRAIKVAALGGEVLGGYEVPPGFA